MKKNETALLKLRAKVDKIDLKLTRLLNERTALARCIGLLKAQSGQKIFDPRREKSLLRNLISKNNGPLENTELAGIYKLILKTSRRHQKKLRG